jgi:hypothetical protein
VLLRIGENKILIEVTSANRLTTRTYVVTAYVLMEQIVGTSLSMLAPSSGEMQPEFESEEYKYSVVVPFETEEMQFRVASVLDDPVAVCLVTALEEELRALWVGPPRQVRSQMECYVTPSGRESEPLPVNVGFNLFEFKAVPEAGGIGSQSEVLYEILVFRSRDGGGPIAIEPSPPPTAEDSPPPSLPSPAPFPFPPPSTPSPPPAPPAPFPPDDMLVAKASLRLIAGSPGFPSSSANGSAYRGTGRYSRTFQSFLNAAPGSGGAVELFLGGDECAGGSLEGLPFENQLSRTFITARAPLAAIASVLRTKELTYDDTTVSLVYTATDASHRPQVQTNGLTVFMVLTNIATAETVMAECALPNAVTGVGGCVVTSPPALKEWFKVDTAFVTVHVQVRGSYASAPTARISSPVMSLQLMRYSPPATLTSAGAALKLPQARHLPGASFPATLTAHTDGNTLTSWLVAIEYDVSLLELSSFAVDPRYNEPVVNEQPGKSFCFVFGWSDKTCDVLASVYQLGSYPMTGRMTPVVSCGWSGREVFAVTGRMFAVTGRMFAVTGRMFAVTGRMFAVTGRMTPVVSCGWSGRVVFAVTGARSGIRVEDLTGIAVPLLDLTFVCSATALEGVYNNAVRGTVLDFVNIGTNSFLQDVPMQMDSFGSAESARVDVRYSAPVGIYSYLSQAEVFNTAFLTGEEIVVSG